MEPWRILAVIGVYVAIQQLEGNLLTPRIQGHALRVHAIVVFLAVVAGGELAGLPGALFAVPALAIIRVLLDFLRARLRVVNPLPAPVQLVEQEVVIIEPPAPAPTLPTDSD
jgi:predicted PurR-regulated permease PerM